MIILVILLFILLQYGCSNQPSVAKSWTGANGAMKVVDCTNRPRRDLVMFWTQSVDDLPEFISSSECFNVCEVVINEILDPRVLEQAIDKIHSFGIDKVGIKLAQWSDQIDQIDLKYPNDHIMIPTNKASNHDLQKLRISARVSLFVPLGGLYQVFTNIDAPVRIYYGMTKFWNPSRSKYTDPYSTPFRTIRPTRDLVEFLTRGDSSSPIPNLDLEFLKIEKNIVIVVNVEVMQRNKKTSIEFGALKSLNDFMQCLSELDEKLLNGSTFAISSKIPTSWL